MILDKVKISHRLSLSGGKLKEVIAIYAKKSHHLPNMLPTVSSLTERPASVIKFLMYLQLNISNRHHKHSA